ncbi:MAG: hypothetical protein V4437_00265 [Patescibacteria group bacterium]
MKNTHIKFSFASFLAVLALVTISFTSLPSVSHAGPTAPLDCSGVTWAHTYTIETNPFPPNTAGFAAWGAVYGESHLVESTYQVARIGDAGGEGCEPPPAAPSVTLIAVPPTIDAGSSSLLSWVGSNVASCSSDDFATGGSPTGNRSVSPTATKVYTITCTDGAQTVNSSATIVVNPPTAPTVTLNANPDSINNGSSSTLSWTSTNASFCTGTGFNTSGNVSGSVSTGALSATTNYSIVCTGASSSASSGGTSAVSGTWQLQSTDISDLFCPVTNANHVYESVPNCPGTPPPTGTSCSGAIDTCKVNRAVACNIVTKLYSCVGASAGTTAPPPVPPPTASAYATVHVNPPLAISCAPSSATAGPGTPITWTVTPTGGSGSFTYSWFGTDTLSGASASVAKTYLTGGVKTASVTVTDTSSSGTPGTNTTTNTPGGGSSFSLSGGMQCSGGTLVARSGDTQDGVGFTAGAGDALSAECQNIMGSGNCCSVTVREMVNPQGQPINTFYSYASYSGASLVSKDSYSTGVSGKNHTNYNFFGGTFSEGSTGGSSSTTVTPPTTSTSASSLSTSCSTFICSGDACTNPPPVTPPGTPGSDSGGGTPGGTGTTPGGTGTTPGTPGASSLSALLTAFPITVPYGSSSLLSWTSAHATSCTGGNFTTGGATAGTLSVTPAATTLYSLTCTDAAGNNAFSTATVTVVAPSLTITGTPQLVRSGSSTTISWHANGPVHSCSVSGPGLSSTASSGSQTIVIHAESTFTFSCAAGAFSPVVSTTVKVLPAFNEI